MVVKVKLLRDLQTFPDDEGIGVWVKLEDWMGFLRKKKAHGEPEIRKSSLRKEFLYHQNLKVIDGGECISMSGVIAFCYGHKRRRAACKEICTQIEEVLDVCSQTGSTVLQI